MTKQQLRFPHPRIPRLRTPSSLPQNPKTPVPQQTVASSSSIILSNSRATSLSYTAPLPPNSHYLPPPSPIPPKRTYSSCGFFSSPTLCSSRATSLSYKLPLPSSQESQNPLPTPTEEPHVFLSPMPTYSSCGSFSSITLSSSRATSLVPSGLKCSPSMKYSSCHPSFFCISPHRSTTGSPSFSPSSLHAAAYCPAWSRVRSGGRSSVVPALWN